MEIETNVGILIVHGIGDQKQGEALKDVVNGFYKLVSKIRENHSNTFKIEETDIKEI